jgi:cytochrome c peroxidase
MKISIFVPLGAALTLAAARTLPSADQASNAASAKASCVQCHTGWNFTGNGFHDTGVVITTRFQENA